MAEENLESMIFTCSAGDFLASRTDREDLVIVGGVYISFRSVHPDASFQIQGKNPYDSMAKYMLRNKLLAVTDIQISQSSHNEGHIYGTGIKKN